MLRELLASSRVNGKYKAMYIWPQTPMGSWRVNASLALLSISRLYTGHKTNAPSRMLTITADLASDLIRPASIITKALDTVADIKVSGNHRI
jgi:hypothetical protein